MILLDTNVLSEFMRVVPEARVVAWLDAQIAAIAVARGLRLATRNVADFLNIEALEVINPWDVD